LDIKFEFEWTIKFWVLYNVHRDKTH
jgi:hypothetical protein